jgi:hypothetical protein
MTLKRHMTRAESVARIAFTNPKSAGFAELGIANQAAAYERISRSSLSIAGSLAAVE